MPYLKRAARQHECHPPRSDRGMASAGVGSVWACPGCHQQWAIGRDARGELYWRKLPEQEWLPNPVDLAERAVG